ncbi:MAG: sulfotransferase [Deltaproteobacteria bacterium]|nr:sulfotransferase [Deltaproteobacteria bacterium]
MRIYLRGLATSWRLFGPSRNFVFFVFVILAFMILRILSSFFLFLDYIFFPRFQKVEVKRPVFIIGHPRSGTTFVHHLFTGTDEMAAFKAWHILCPSLTARKLIRPLIRYLASKGLTVLVPEETGHKIDLDQVEEEEMLFLHIHDTQFVIIATPLGFDDDDYREIRFHDLQPRRRRIKSAMFLKSCFQRHIYYTKKTQIFAQTHFSTHRIKTLLEVFPDARFIYLHRRPDETLPSFFSLNYYTLDALWGLHRFTSEQILRYYRYQYEASLDLYRYFYSLWHTNGIDKNKVLIIPYEKLREDLPAVFENIIDFTGIEPGDRLRRAVKEQAKKQRGYRRRHNVKALEDFGIDEKSIKRDFSFMFEKDPFSIRQA